MQLFMFNIGSQFHRIQKFLVLIIIILLSLNVNVKAQPMGGILTYVEEQDGTPSGVYWKLIFPNDTVTDNGDGTVTISVTGTGGGDITDVGDATTGAAFTPNGPGNVLYFEGPTADDFETILQGQDVTADVTINLPSSSGTLLNKEQIDTESEFENLLFDVIVPTEIDTSAELASIVTDETGSGALVFGTSPTFTTDITTPKVKNSGDITIDATSSSANTTITVTNSDATYVANLAVEGTITEGGNGVLNTTELDTEAELESLLSDVTNVYTNNDGALTDDDLSDNSIGDLSDVDTTGVADGKVLKYNAGTSKWEVADDADTTYSAGTGLSLSGTTFSLSHLGLESLSDPNANRLYFWNDTNNTTEWLDYSAWDTDASDDLTTSTSFGGDVSGTYDNLQLGSGVVTTTEIADGTIDDGDISSSADTRIAAIEVIIDGGGSEITTGVKADIEVPFNCTILQATALADQTGSIQVDIWKDTYANFPPTDADSITGSNPISISSSNKSQDSTLSGWTTTISAGDILRFNVDSCSTITRCTISLKVRKD